MSRAQHVLCGFILVGACFGGWIGASTLVPPLDSSPWPVVIVGAGVGGGVGVYLFVLAAVVVAMWDDLGAAPMSRSLYEIREHLGEIDALSDPASLISLVYDLCEHVLSLEARLSKAEKVAASAANTAGCLANGMRPD